MVRTMRMIWKNSRLAALALVFVGPATASATENGPVIGEIEWHRVDSYCNFFKSGHVFDFDKPESWRFLFLTFFTSDNRIAVERGYANINGLLRELELAERTETENGERRIYRTFGDAPVTLTIDMRAGKGGSEHTSYTGTIVASDIEGSTSVDFTGDCGV